MLNKLKETDGMRLLTIFAALLAAFAVGGGLALATGGGSSSGIDLTGSTTEIGTTTGDEAGDISGPCDEAEHANDPRCTGVTVPGVDDNGDDDGPGDISGPCDEAEHANDPRCTGADPGDSSGPGHGGRDDDDDDDRSGHRGGDDDNSGPGSGGDDDHGDDDNSGSGSGGSGSGSSGSG
jgi:hypothetical protein